MKVSAGNNRRIARGSRTPGGVPGLRRSLQWRVLALVAIGLAVMLAGLAVFSFLAVDECTERTLEEREMLARITASHLDYIVRQNLKILDNVPFAEGFDLEDSDPAPEAQALRRVYFSSIFSGGVYLLDKSGEVLWTEPRRSGVVGTNLGGQAHVAEALAGGRPVVSGLTAGVLAGEAAVSVLSPVRSPSGRLVGLVGGDIDLGDLENAISASAPGETGYIHIVDEQGMILASSRPWEAVGVSGEEDGLSRFIAEGRVASAAGQEGEVMAYSPLAWAPWGVVIRQAESEALAPARHLRERAIWLGILAFPFALAFAWATVRSVIGPVGVLTEAAQRIASGDLSEQVPALGEDEIGQLARAFETMRVRLRDSLERIQAWGRELEERVRERTSELEASRDHLRAVAEENAALYEELKRKEAVRGELLNKVITAQEEERRRIARELHDETSQALTALVVGMETAMLAPPRSKAQLQEKLAGLKDLAVTTLDGVHNLIYDLRPSILDDLGLVASLEWYAERRLEPLAVRVEVEVSGQETRLPPEVETALFRVGQEAISNVARHSEARNLFVGVEFQDAAVVLEVEDDGKGFDVQTVTGGPSAWGILGMRERTALLGGTLDITSHPGGGTRVRVWVPLDARGGQDEEDSGPDSRRSRSS